MYLYGEMFSLIFKMHCTVLNNQISRIKEMNIFNDSKDMIRTLSHTAWWEWPLAQSLQKSSWQYLSRTLKIFISWVLNYNSKYRCSYVPLKAQPKCSTDVQGTGMSL